MGNNGIFNFEGAFPIISLFLLTWGVLEQILKIFEGDIWSNFVRVPPSSVPFSLAGANPNLTSGIITGERVIDSLSREGGGCEVVGVIYRLLSLLSTVEPCPRLICLSMSVTGTMFMYMFPLSESKLVAHLGSHPPRPNLMTTFIFVSELHSVFTICSIGGETSTFIFG